MSAWVQSCSIAPIARLFPPGGALAVDRVKFSELVEAEVAARPNIEVVHGEVTQIPEGHVVIAAGRCAHRR